MGWIVPPTQRSAVPTNTSEFGSAGAVAAAAGGGASGGAIASARDARSSAPAFEAAPSASPAAATGGAAAAALSAGALAGGAQPLLQAAPLPQAKSCCDPGCAGAYGGCACGSAHASGARANSAREFIGVVMDAIRDDPAYDSGRSSATITGERILEPDVAAKRQRRVEVQARYRDRNKLKIAHFRRALDIGIPALIEFMRANADVGSIRIGTKCVQLARRYCALGGKLPARCLEPMQVSRSALPAAAVAAAVARRTVRGVPRAAVGAPAAARGPVVRAVVEESGGALEAAGSAAGGAPGAAGTRVGGDAVRSGGT